MGCSLSVRISPEETEQGKAPRRCRDKFVRTSNASTSSMATPLATMRGRGKTLKKTPSLAIGEGLHALVVGINHYTHWQDLDCPVKDAMDIGKWLLSKGFTVTMLLGDAATFQNIVRAMLAIPACKTAVVSLHGHGARGARASSFVPHDACEDPDDVSDKISVDFLQSWSMRWEGKRALLIADCCFGGNFVLPPRVKMRGHGDSQKERVRIVISASTMDEMIPDREGGHTNSPMTRSILRAMRSKGWGGSVLDLFVRVRKMSPPGCAPKVGRLPGDEGGDIWLL